MSGQRDSPARSHDVTVHDVRVWSASLASMSPAALDALASPCSAAERRRSRALVFERDRRSYLAAHGLLRHALSDYAPLYAPSEWLFQAGPHGRPEIANARPARLRFNLTHCATRVACVVCRELDCGIDLEATSRAAESAVLIRRCLSAREQEWVARAGPERRGERFLQLWTLKEAVAKAVGLGLALPFAALELEVGRPPRVRRAPPEAARPWWLAVRRSADGHFEALALHVARHDAVALVYEEWTR